MTQPPTAPAPKLLTHEQLCARIEREIELRGGLGRTARYLKVSRQLLGDMLRGDRSIGPKLQKALNVRRIISRDIFYEPIPKGAKHGRA